MLHRRRHHRCGYRLHGRGVGRRAAGTGRIGADMLLNRGQAGWLSKAHARIGLMREIQLSQGVGCVTVTIKHLGIEVMSPRIAWVILHDFSEHLLRAGIVAATQRGLHLLLGR